MEQTNLCSSSICWCIAFVIYVAWRDSIEQYSLLRAWKRMQASWWDIGEKSPVEKFWKPVSVWAILKAKAKMTPQNVLNLGIKLPSMRLLRNLEEVEGSGKFWRLPVENNLWKMWTVFREAFNICLCCKMTSTCGKQLLSLDRQIYFYTR